MREGGREGRDRGRGREREGGRKRGGRRREGGRHLAKNVHARYRCIYTHVYTSICTCSYSVHAHLPCT